MKRFKCWSINRHYLVLKGVQGRKVLPGVRGARPRLSIGDVPRILFLFSLPFSVSPRSEGREGRGGVAAADHESARSRHLPSRDDPLGPFDGVHIFPVHPQAPVQMSAGRKAGRTDQTEAVANAHCLSGRDQNL